MNYNIQILDMIDKNTISPNYLIQTTELSNDSIWEIEDNNL